MTRQVLGSPSPPAARVLVASDWAPIRAFDSIVRHDPESIYGDLLPVIRGADLRIVNCECALTRASRAVWKSGAVFKGDPAHVQGLTLVPFDVACLGNNHVLDYGVAGLRDTLDLLAGHGIDTVGAGLTEEAACAPLLCSANRVRVHIINFSEGEDQTEARGGPGVFGWDLPRVQRLVRDCKRRGGVVIAIGHCGLEYVPYPPPYVVSAFRAIVDAGADAVIGHHPHVPQGMEFYNGRPIFYSLGNFVFYQPTPLWHRKVGFFVTLDVDPGVVRGAEAAPVPDHRHRPARAASRRGPRLPRDAGEDLLAVPHGRRSRTRLGRVPRVLRCGGVDQRGAGHHRADEERAREGGRDVPQPDHDTPACGTVGGRPHARHRRRTAAVLARVYRTVEEWFTRTVDADAVRPSAG